MDISVIIPTCNRKQRLLSLLQNLIESSVRPLEILIIDSGDDILTPTENTAVVFAGDSLVPGDGTQRHWIIHECKRGS